MRANRIIIAGISALWKDPPIPELSRLSIKDRWKINRRCQKQACRQRKTRIVFFVTWGLFSLFFFVGIYLMIRDDSFSRIGLISAYTGMALAFIGMTIHRSLYVRLSIPFIRAELPGLCRGCGYDLRATPTRCPECGVIPPNLQEVSADSQPTVR